MSNTSTKINLLNIINVAAYVFNTTFTYGVGNAGWFGGSTNSDLSLKYQTIVTPSSWAFSIWAVIFVFQAIYCVVQLLPPFRSHPMVQIGVSYFYVATCLSQAGWTFAFAFELIPLSLFLMALIWISLAGILYRQYGLESEGTLREFWLLRFPFAVHFGWITAATLLNVNVVTVKVGPGAGTELAVGIVSLAILHAISVVVLFLPKRPQYTIPCVLAWANGAIYYELANTRDPIKERFSEDAISGVSYAALAVCFIILTQVMIRVVTAIVAWCVGKKARLQGEDSHTLDKENSVAVM